MHHPLSSEISTKSSDNSLKVSGPIYEAGIQDAIAWVVLNYQNYKPEALAEYMAFDLLSDKTLKRMGVNREQK